MCGEIFLKREKIWLFWLPSLEAFNTYLLNICYTLGTGFIEASKAHFLLLRKSHTKGEN